jgi:DNA polymerase
MELDEDEAGKHVNTYREAYSEIPAFWRAAEDAAFTAVREKTKRNAGVFQFRYDKPFLFIDLPAGRSLAYYRPRIQRKATPWGGERDQLTYEGKEAGKHMRISTHPGKITENIVQAIARDVLAHGLTLAAADSQLEIVGHVHDEILCLADVDDGFALDRLLEYMSQPPSWCSDAPIRAEGWRGEFYRKD